MPIEVSESSRPDTKGTAAEITPSERMRTVHDEREFLVYGQRRLTYAQHRAAVAQLARALEEKYDIRVGDRVAILGGNSPEWILTFWAVTSLGGIAVALNGWWSAGGSVLSHRSMIASVGLQTLNGAAMRMRLIEAERVWRLSNCRHRPSAALRSRGMRPAS